MTKMKKMKEHVVKKTKQGQKWKKVMKNGAVMFLCISSCLFGIKHYTETQLNEVSSSKMLIAKETLKGINPFRENVNIEDLKFIYEDLKNYHYSDTDYLKDKSEYFLFRNVLLQKYRDFLNYANLKDNNSDEEIINDLNFNFISIINYMSSSSMNDFHNKKQNMEDLSYLSNSIITEFNFYYAKKHNIKFKNYNYDQRNFNKKREELSLGDIYYKFYMSTLYKNMNEANLVLNKNPELMSYMIRDYGDSYEQIKKMSVSGANEIEKGMKKNRDLNFELNDSELKYVLKKISYIRNKSKIMSQQIDREKFNNFNYSLVESLSPIIEISFHDLTEKDINKVNEQYIKVIINDFNLRQKY